MLQKIEFIIEKPLAKLVEWRNHARKALNNDLCEFFRIAERNPAQTSMEGVRAAESLGNPLQAMWQDR